MHAVKKRCIRPSAPVGLATPVCCAPRMLLGRHTNGRCLHWATEKGAVERSRNPGAARVICFSRDMRCAPRHSTGDVVEEPQEHDTRQARATGVRNGQLRQSRFHGTSRKQIGIEEGVDVSRSFILYCLDEERSLATCYYYLSCDGETPTSGNTADDTAGRPCVRPCIDRASRHDVPHTVARRRTPTPALNRSFGSA